MIKNFTDKFLTCSRVTLFILFLMEGFNWYNSSDTTPGYVTSVVNLLGVICYLAWIYAIGHRANERLQKRNITLDIFKYFNYGFIVIIGSVVTMFFLSQGITTIGEDTGNISYHITYSKPVWLALIFVAALIFIDVVAAKALMSAEENKEMEFGDYFKTFLMLAFSWIGLWWIQPRVQKL